MAKKGKNKPSAMDLPGDAIVPEEVENQAAGDGLQAAGQSDLPVADTDPEPKAQSPEPVSPEAQSPPRPTRRSEPWLAWDLRH